MVGSLAVLLLIVLNASGHLSFSLHGMPRHIRSTHRKAAEVDFTSEKATDELDVLLWAAQQADATGATSDDGSSEDITLDAADPGRLHLLEESPPTSEVSISSHGHDQEALPAAAELDSLDSMMDLLKPAASMQAGKGDGALRQELLQRNLQRPQISGEANAYDGPWDQRYAMAKATSAQQLEDEQDGLLESKELLMHDSWPKQQMPASHLKPASSTKRFLSGNEDTPLQHQPNCPAPVEIEKLEQLPFCHNNLPLPGHLNDDLHGTASITSGRDSTAHGLPRVQDRARMHKPQAGASGQQDDERDVCAPLLGVKKVALLFLTRGDLYHADLWGTWLEAASGDARCPDTACLSPLPRPGSHRSLASAICMDMASMH